MPVFLIAFYEIVLIASLREKRHLKRGRDVGIESFIWKKNRSNREGREGGRWFQCTMRNTIPCVFFCFFIFIFASSRAKWKKQPIGSESWSALIEHRWNAISIDKLSSFDREWFLVNKSSTINNVNVLITTTIIVVFFSLSVLSSSSLCSYLLLHRQSAHFVILSCVFAVCMHASTRRIWFFSPVSDK